MQEWLKVLTGVVVGIFLSVGIFFATKDLQSAKEAKESAQPDMCQELGQLDKQDHTSTVYACTINNVPCIVIRAPQAVSVDCDWQPITE